MAVDIVLPMQSSFQERCKKGLTMENVVAGASLGGLLGLIVGMSASPVSSIVVSALAALLGGVVSVTPSGSLTFHPVRLASFGTAAITALLCGLLLRTYNVLAPSTAHYVKELTTAGLPADRAIPLAIRLRFGVTEQGEASPPAAASRSDSVFFSDEADMRCSNTARNEYPRHRASSRRPSASPYPCYMGSSET